MKNWDIAGKFIALRAQGIPFARIELRAAANIRPIGPIGPIIPIHPLDRLSRPKPIAKPVWKWSGFGLEMRQLLPLFMQWRLTPPINPPTAYEKVKFCSKSPNRPHVISGLLDCCSPILKLPIGKSFCYFYALLGYDEPRYF
jgi:hypothetical protein